MIIYLIKSASCLALLLFFYHLILEKEKMHNFNRFYLLGSVLFSFLIPLATITVKTASDFKTFNKEVFIENIKQTDVNQTINYSNLLIGIYLLISTIFLIRFAINLFKIIQKTRKNENIKYKKATLVLIDDEILPHTFWNTIFINKRDYNNGKIEEELFTHELTHINQKHTLDILLIELLQIVLWINPLFILLKKAVQLNHEFLADEKVINQHKNTYQYQHLLLNKAKCNNTYYLASNLNYSLTKKRLKMMTKQSSKTKVLTKQLAVIPLLIGFLFLFAQRIQAQEKAKTKKIVETVFYLDGKEISKKEIDKLNNDKIESVNVNKEKDGTSKVYVKQKKEPIYYLYGKLITKKEMKLISPEKIKSVDVKKNKDGSGAVYITSKKN